MGSESQTEVLNSLLLQLSDDTRAAVLNKSEYVFFDVREQVAIPNTPLTTVEFPQHGVLSIVRVMEDGTNIEIGTVGREGMVGFSVVTGVIKTPELIFCQVEGTAWRLPMDEFKLLVEQYDELRVLCLRFSSVFLHHVATNLACNKVHSLEERCARWLLTTHERCGRSEFMLTQDFLATMLGSSRGAVNLAAGMLSKAGLISYVRGRMNILDREGLSSISCQCHEKERMFAQQVFESFN